MSVEQERTTVLHSARLRRVILVAAWLAVAAGLVLAVGALVVGQRSLRNADVGDCLAFDAAKTRYTRVDCADSSAGFRLFGSREEPKACVDVPGVSRVYGDSTGSYCIGDKDVDAATTINGVAVGECVRFSNGQPSRSACDAGALPVLGVVNDVPRHADADNDYLGDICVDRGIKKVRRTYAWGLITSSEAGTWDRLLCLGRAAG